MGQILWWIKQDETMQIYDDFEGFGANFCIVWVGNIMTPGFSPKSQALKIAMDCRIVDLLGSRILSEFDHWLDGRFTCLEPQVSIIFNLISS